MAYCQAFRSLLNYHTTTLFYYYTNYYTTTPFSRRVAYCRTYRSKGCSLQLVEATAPAALLHYCTT